MLKKSVIIVAHPDDENLWFSSVLEEMDKIVFCFLGSRNQPLLGNARRKSLAEYPLKNVSCMGLDQSDTFNGANWQTPVLNQYGIKISSRKKSDEIYKQNYHKLKGKLKDVLADFMNVFTHNPWGEYGHEDHVQVYRVIKELQSKMKFNLWYSNYCSNKSFNLMLRYIAGSNSNYVTLKTNKTLAHALKTLYEKKGCWTWYDTWEWFNEESFLQDNISMMESEPHGHFFPVNLIKINIPHKKEAKPILSRLIDKGLLWFNRRVQGTYSFRGLLKL